MKTSFAVMLCLAATVAAQERQPEITRDWPKLTERAPDHAAVPAMNGG